MATNAKEVMTRLETLKNLHTPTPEQPPSLAVDHTGTMEPPVQSSPAVQDPARYSSAGRHVADTTEVLELILEFLPMRDLLFAQKVNRYFKHLIDGSMRLQRALYFQPAPVKLNASGEYQAPVENPLLPLLGRKVSDHGIPLLQMGRKTMPCSFSIQTKQSTGQHRYWTVVRVRPTSEIGEGGVRCYAHGSWRKMYATQPPTNHALDLISGAPIKRLVDPIPKLGELFPASYYVERDPVLVGDN